MAKIILKDGTEITDVIDVSVSGFSKNCTAEEMATIFDSLSVNTLERYELHDGDDNLVSIYSNKRPSSCSFNGETATFIVSDVDLTEQRLSALEDTIDTMLLDEMGV